MQLCRKEVCAHSFGSNTAACVTLWRVLQMLSSHLVHSREWGGEWFEKRVKSMRQLRNKPMCGATYETYKCTRNDLSVQLHIGGEHSAHSGVCHTRWSQALLSCTRFLPSALTWMNANCDEQLVHQQLNGAQLCEQRSCSFECNLVSVVVRDHNATRSAIRLASVLTWPPMGPRHGQVELPVSKRMQSDVECRARAGRATSESNLTRFVAAGILIATLTTIAFNRTSKYLELSRATQPPSTKNNEVSGSHQF